MALPELSLTNLKDIAVFVGLVVLGAALPAMSPD